MENKTESSDTTSACEVLVVVNTLVLMILTSALLTKGLVAKPVLLAVLVVSLLVVTVQSARIRSRKRKRNQSLPVDIQTNERDSYITEKWFVINSAVLFVSLFSHASLMIFLPDEVLKETPQLHQGKFRSLQKEEAPCYISLEDEQDEYLLDTDSFFSGE